MPSRHEAIQHKVMQQAADDKYRQDGGSHLAIALGYGGSNALGAIALSTSTRFYAC